jgi:hypothetical protein
MKGKPWSKEEVDKLRDLLKSGKRLKTIAEILGKTEDAVYLKCRRLGLLVEEEVKGYTSSTTELILPKKLPSVQEALAILAAALKKSAESGLDKVEVQRLQVVATLAKTYKDILADYINYRQIERELLELKEKYERLSSKKA